MNFFVRNKQTYVALRMIKCVSDRCVPERKVSYVHLTMVALDDTSLEGRVPSSAPSKSNQIKSKSLFSFSSVANSDAVQNIHTDKLLIKQFARGLMGVLG